MVYGMFKPGEQKKEEEETVTKADSLEKFLKTQDVKQLTEEFMREGYTKRGINDLLSVVYSLYNTDKMIVKRARAILTLLKGKDGLKGFFAGLKLSTEGLLKALKK